jgi:hypothetical protein
MAEKRMLSKVISISEKVNIELQDTFHMLLYTWMIPHTDDFGRLAGSPAKVKALVIPMLEKTKKDVEEALSCLHDVGLINWYEIDGDRFIQMKDFEQHQSGLHKRTKSKFPEPPNLTSEIPGSSGKITDIPSELNRTELKRTEENRTEENRTEEKGIEQNLSESPENLEDVKNRLRLLTIECGLKGVGIDGLETIYSYIGQVETAVIEKAIKKTEKKYVAYFMSIINGWIGEGKTTLELLNPIPQAGAPPANGNAQRSRSGKPSLPVVKDEGPSKVISPEEREKMRELARAMRDGAVERH